MDAGQVISIHPPREGWDSSFVIVLLAALISIHPPREGWDRIVDTLCPAFEDFNPPTPRGVGLDGAEAQIALKAFQSTHPARGGTIDTAFCRYGGFNFNPPTPRGVGPLSMRAASLVVNFNPPTPRGVGQAPEGRNFGQSDLDTTPPRGVGPDRGEFIEDCIAISIHPPREGWDTGTPEAPVLNFHFNPPTPRGVGHNPGERSVKP